MEKPNHWLIALGAFFFVGVTGCLDLRASGDSHEAMYYEKIIYQSYIRNDMTRWKNVLDSLQQKTHLDDALRLDLINYLYGYIGWCMGVDRKEEARRYLKQAEAHLELLKPNMQYAADVKAYQSAFYGYHIGLNHWKAPILGPRSVEAAKEAIRLDSGNPMGYLQYANSLYYRPAVLGGSKSEALVLYLHALQRMDARMTPHHKNWNYLNLLVLIAQAYGELGKMDDAENVYKNILLLEPNFEWIKNELYPKHLQQRKK